MCVVGGQTSRTAGVHEYERRLLAVAIPQRGAEKCNIEVLAADRDVGAGQDVRLDVVAGEMQEAKPAVLNQGEEPCQIAYFVCRLQLPAQRVHLRARTRRRVCRHDEIGLVEMHLLRGWR